MSVTAQSVKNGMVVEIDYSVEDTDGHFIASSERDGTSLTYLHGFRNIIVGLENYLTGKSVGFSGSVSIASADAYGKYDARNVIVAERGNFPADTDLQVGDQVQGEGEFEHAYFIVKSIDAKDIHLDANHPLAGRDLVYQVKVLSVRNATKAELNAGFVDSTPTASKLH